MFTKWCDISFICFCYRHRQEDGECHIRQQPPSAVQTRHGIQESGQIKLCRPILFSIIPVPQLKLLSTENPAGDHQAQLLHPTPRRGHPQARTGLERGRWHWPWPWRWCKPCEVWHVPRARGRLQQHWLNRMHWRWSGGRGQSRKRTPMQSRRPWTTERRRQRREEQRKTGRKRN